MKVLQEKSQVTLPEQDNDDGEGGWKSFESARQNQPPLTPRDRTNHLPAGMEIENQEWFESNRMKKVLSGSTDVSQDGNEGALRKGYTKRAMAPTEDAVSSKNDAFYDEITVDGSTGFAERNNVLDRI